MADDVIARWKQLKPAAVDRDALLMAVGRAGAPRAKPWKLACGGLLLSQILILIFWLRPMEERTKSPEGNPIPIPAESPSVPVSGSASFRNLDLPPEESVPTAAVAPESHWSVRMAPGDLQFD